MPKPLFSRGDALAECLYLGCDDGIKGIEGTPQSKRVLVNKSKILFPHFAERNPENKLNRQRTPLNEYGTMTRGTSSLVIVADKLLLDIWKLRDLKKSLPSSRGVLSLAQAFSEKNLAARFFVITKG
jgi:hypothetical protein